MGLFTLKVENGDISKAILEKTKTDSIDYEKDFENWLENSPNVLFEDDEMNSVIWIGRQPTAKVGESDKIPDLIGIDSTGDLVVVELKKERLRERLLPRYSNMPHGVQVWTMKGLTKSLKHITVKKTLTSKKACFKSIVRLSSQTQRKKFP